MESTLVVPREPERYEERVAFDLPLDNLEPLLFMLNRVLGDFCKRLDSCTMSAGAIHLTLELEAPTAKEVHMELPVPTRDAAVLIRLLRAKLEANPPQANLTAFNLRLDPIRPRFLQHDLYTPPQPEPEKLDLTLAKIRGFLGEDRVGTPVLLDTHRPDAWKLRSLPELNAKPEQHNYSSSWGLAFRFFRPPRQARIDLERHAPIFVTAEGVRGKVAERAGPWMRSGDWWMGTAWSRADWDVSLESGGVYRIYLNLPVNDSKSSTSSRWFIEGSYD